MTGFTFLPGRRVSAHLMMQSSVAARLMGDEMLNDMGLLARCLAVEPDSTIGRRLVHLASLTALAAPDVAIRRRTVFRLSVIAPSIGKTGEERYGPSKGFAGGRLPGGIAHFAAR